MKIGYARTSTLDQVAGFEAQLRELEAIGCEKVFKEQLSSVADHRPQLEACLDFIRDGDTLIVTKLDRLARSVADLLRIVERAKAKGAVLEVQGLGRFNGDASSQLLLNVLGAVAQFERQVMLERQREGIARAKAEGKYKGRAPTARAKSANRGAARSGRRQQAGDRAPARNTPGQCSPHARASEGCLEAPKRKTGASAMAPLVFMGWCGDRPCDRYNK